MTKDFLEIKIKAVENSFYKNLSMQEGTALFIDMCKALIQYIEESKK